jgi:hypothetical protein
MHTSFDEIKSSYLKKAKSSLKVGKLRGGVCTEMCLRTFENPLTRACKMVFRNSRDSDVSTAELQSQSHKSMSHLTRASRSPEVKLLLCILSTEDHKGHLQ